ncbi:hypothetical protein [Chitinimonas lacunae]|uniref:Uncharacterized protein n=1 Tax=Chitinimonas lacunae TaxID=1963018 RepID=A0ABV8MRN0_9NEIS
MLTLLPAVLWLVPATAWWFAFRGMQNLDPLAASLQDLLLLRYVVICFVIAFPMWSLYMGGALLRTPITNDAEGHGTLADRIADTCAKRSRCLGV